MPVIKSAKKKLKQDKRRQLENAKVRNALKDLIKKARKNPSDESVRLTATAADKAVKKHIIHKNKAARIKSSLATQLHTQSSKKAGLPTSS